MAQTYPLDKVIRVVDPDYRVTSPNERMIGIDLSTFQAVEVIDLHGRTKLQRAGFLGRFKARKYLAVANNGDIQNEAEGPMLRFELRDFAYDWRLGLQLKYLVSCSGGNEVKLAESLGNGSHPGAVLTDLLNKWIKEYSGNNQADFIENYYSRKDDFLAHLSRRAIAEIGLNLTASVQLEAESSALGPIVIPPIHFPVRFNDDNEERDLKLETEVQVDPDRKILAMLSVSRNHTIEELIKTKTREYFAASVSLNTFRVPAERRRLEQSLKKQLDVFLLPFGRQLAFVSLGRVDEIEDAFFEAKRDVRFANIQEYDREVVINNTVQMSLRDYVLYKNSGVKTLNAWLDENLPQIIHNVLFGKRYIDLLVGFGPLEKEIKQRLSERAESIGYTIRHLITVPDLPPYEWLENFDVEVEREYETNMPKFPVKLGVIVTARIRRLQDIENYLNRRQDVPKLMRDAIESEVRRFLHSVDPERFYMRFSFTEPDEPEPAIEQALRELIETRLEEKFKAEIIAIVFKMRDTDITDVWSTLEKSEGELLIKLPSFSDTEGVTYRARVRIESIHSRGWNRFRTSSPEIEKICERLSEHVLSQLGTFANADLVYTHIETQKQIEKLIEALAKKYATEEFGLVIRVTNIRREATIIEVDERARIRALLTAVADVERELIAEIKSGGTDEKINDIKRRKEILESQVPDSVAGTRSKFTRAGLIEAPAPTRLADVVRGRKSLTAGAGNHRQNGDGDSV
jgi:hypothetical protein